MGGGSHLVHPGQAVILVASSNKACLGIDLQTDIEALAGHIGVDLIACVPFSKGDASSVILEDLLNDLIDKHDPLLPFSLESFVFELVIAQEDHTHLVFQDLVVLGLVDILSYGTDEPPTGIPTVVTGTTALV